MSVSQEGRFGQCAGSSGGEDPSSLLARRIAPASRSPVTESHAPTEHCHGGCASPAEFVSCELTIRLQAAEPKKAPKGRKGRRAAVAEAEAADAHAEEIEIIGDGEEGDDSGASQVQPPCSCCQPHCTTASKCSSLN